MFRSYPCQEYHSSRSDSGCKLEFLFDREMPYVVVRFRVVKFSLNSDGENRTAPKPLF